jgi:hypothetical protein
MATRSSGLISVLILNIYFQCPSTKANVPLKYAKGERLEYQKAVRRFSWPALGPGLEKTLSMLGDVLAW